jgi:hypothetical protein
MQKALQCRIEKARVAEILKAASAGAYENAT